MSRQVKTAAHSHHLLPMLQSETRQLAECKAGHGLWSHPNPLGCLGGPARGARVCVCEREREREGGRDGQTLLIRRADI